VQFYLNQPNGGSSPQCKLERFSLERLVARCYCRDMAQDPSGSLLPQKRWAIQRYEVASLTWGLIETHPKQKGAPALLFLPGTLGTAEIFGNQIETLADRARVMSVTYPICDDATKLADGVAGLMDRLEIARAVVVGSSLGGFVAQWFAARHPSRIAALVIGNSLWNPAVLKLTEIQRERLAQLPAAQHRAIVLDSVRSWPETETIFSELKKFLIECGTKLLTAQELKARVLAVQLSTAIPKLDLPAANILVLDCADDPLIPRAVQDDLVNRYPGAKHERFAVGGHYPYLTRPDEYTSVIEHVLDRAAK
jgi:maspardin